MKLGMIRGLATGAGAALLALTVGVGAAQEATPITDASSGVESGQPHPAHIHAGNCVTLDPAPLFPLADIVIPQDAAGMTETMVDSATPIASPVASPAAQPGAAGSPTAAAAGQSTTQVEAGLSDILAAEHAINVHLSYEQVDVYIACGAIGGTPDANGDLFVGLAEQNDSGYSGIAWLHDNGDGTTNVTVFLTLTEAVEAGAAEDAASPAASPAA